MVRAMLLLLLLLLVSCTTNKVHVFNNSLSEVELTALTQDLVAQGLSPRVRELDVPVGITGPTIVMPRVVRDQATIHAVEDVLNRHGITGVQVESHAVHNHSYTDDNMGLYLTSREIARERQAAVRRVDLEVENLARVYMSECESIDAELNLSADGLAVLEIYQWDGKSANEDSRFFAGNWQAEGLQLNLTLDQTEPLTFAIAESQTTSTAHGDTRGIDLLRTSVATEQDYSRCNFRYIEQVL